MAIKLKSDYLTEEQVILFFFTCFEWALVFYCSHNFFVIKTFSAPDTRKNDGIYSRYFFNYITTGRYSMKVCLLTLMAYLL